MAWTQRTWRLLPADDRAVAALAQEMGVSYLIARLLWNRKIRTTEEVSSFLSAAFPGHDPFLLKDCDRAVARILRAREKGERILIYGDYDVDGITSTALLYRTLTERGWSVETFIPHRLNDGYGLTPRLVEWVREHRIGCCLSVDCGITAHEVIADLQASRVDVVVLDHHMPDRRGLPPATAVVDPKREDCPYPFKGLAAVGLTAKFVQALTGRFPEEFLDMIALGTVADVVPLLDENRMFVRQGLPCLRQTRNTGLAALMESARIRDRALKPFHAGFILGPRLNASGRMDTARTALNLLLTDDLDEARNLAARLEAVNGERQKRQREMIQEALAMAETEWDREKEKVIVLGKEGWHRGVLGIVASRVADVYYRPAVVMALEEETGTASARSIAGFHLHEALSRCSDLLDNFGGHQLAAGLTLRRDKIEKFRTSLNRVAEELISEDLLIPQLILDSELPFAAISLDLVEQLAALEPHGEGNPLPLFGTRGLTVRGRPRVLARDTLKLWLSDGKKTFSAVGFGMGQAAGEIGPGDTVDAAYHLDIDDWNKAPEVQLRLKDIRRSEIKRGSG